MVIRGKNGIEVEVLAHTKGVYFYRTESPSVITFRIRLHRYVVEQYLKHRVFSNNANSSRAMGVPKMNRHISNNPAEPMFWGARKKGMQPSTSLTGIKKSLCQGLWGFNRSISKTIARLMWSLGAHQQIPNRLTHPFQMANYIVTATDWDNFFNLRLHDKAAQSEITELARCMKEAIDKSTPGHGTIRYFRDFNKTDEVIWHLPYITNEEVELLHEGLLSEEDLLILSAARCCVVSYNNHDTDELMDIKKARRIFNHLISDTNPHYTPLEHQLRRENNTEYGIRLHAQYALNELLLDSSDEEEVNVLREKIRQLNYYANFDRWVSQRYILERYYNGQASAT